MRRRFRLSGSLGFPQYKANARLKDGGDIRASRRILKVVGRAGVAIAVILLMTNIELAAQIGTVRNLVSRNLRRLQSKGFFHLGR